MSTQDQIHILHQKLCIVDYFRSENIEVELFATGNELFVKQAKLDLKDLKEAINKKVEKSAWRTNDMCLDITKNRNNEVLFETLLKDKFNDCKFQDNLSDVFIFIENEILEIETRYIHPKDVKYKMDSWFPQLNQWLDFLKMKLKKKQALTQDTPPKKPKEEMSWFKVGLSIAKGEMNQFLIKHKNCFTQIAIHEFGNKNIRPYISESVNNNQTKENNDKNIFCSLTKLKYIIEHCKKNQISIDPAFQKKYTDLKSQI